MPVGSVSPSHRTINIHTVLPSCHHRECRASLVWVSTTEHILSCAFVRLSAPTDLPASGDHRICRATIVSVASSHRTSVYNHLHRVTFSPDHARSCPMKFELLIYTIGAPSYHCRISVEGGIRQMQSVYEVSRAFKLYLTPLSSFFRTPCVRGSIASQWNRGIRKYVHIKKE